MHYFRSSLCLVFCLFSLLAIAQPTPQERVLLIQEQGQKKQYLPQPGKKGILDINGTISVQPNKEAVFSAARKLYPQLFQDSELRSREARINKALRNHQVILDLMQQKVNGLDVQKKLVQQANQFLQDILSDPQLVADYEAINQAYYAQYRNDPNAPDPYLYAFDEFNKQLQVVKTDIQRILQKSKLKFSVVAYIRDDNGGRRVHVENYDRMEQGEFAPVERWVTSVSPEEMQKLQSYRDLAKGLNDNADSVLQAYKQKVLDAYPSLTCIPQLRQELQAAKQTLGPDMKTVVNTFDETETSKLISYGANLRKEIQATPASDVKKFIQVLDSIIALYNGAALKLESSAGDTLKSNIHLQNVVSCLRQSAADARKLSLFIQRIPAEYLKKAYLASDEISDLVDAFDLDNIPNEGTIQLEYTGSRQRNDILDVRAYLRMPKDSGQFTNNQIDQQLYRLTLTGFHSTTKVGLILANAYNETPPPNTARFRFAPAGTLLLKYGSRRSNFYNNFLDPGVGIITASGDMDLDGRPEFMAGVSATLFRDILSAGWTWNFGTDQPTIFVGVHLPFNLPGVPINPVNSYGPNP